MSEIQLTITEENYLKALHYLMQEEPGKLVSTNALAQRLHTKAATVTDMLRKLHRKDLIAYVPYRGTKISEKGQAQATRIVRKHRLWETFLVEKLGFKWDEVHAIAEQMEHIQSPELTNRLEAFLGHPQFDPHGDPIPNREGKFPPAKHRALSAIPASQSVTITAVNDRNSDFLKYLAELHFKLGDTLYIEKIESFDQSVRVQHEGNTTQLSATAAANIYVK